MSRSIAMLSRSLDPYAATPKGVDPHTFHRVLLFSSSSTTTCVAKGLRFEMVPAPCIACEECVVVVALLLLLPPGLPLNEVFCNYSNTWGACQL